MAHMILAVLGSAARAELASGRGNEAPVTMHLAWLPH